jgi:hypothetical protein
MFALNFGTQYFFDFLVLIESMKNDEGNKLIMYD